jgi:O-antigen/teichoic acid export membrane protein
VTIASQLVNLLTRTVGLVVLARLLAPEVFGLAAIVAAITTFTTAVIYLGLPIATVQAESLSQRAKSCLFLINTALGVVFALVLFLAAGTIADIFGDPRLEPMVQWLALVPLLSGLQSQFRLQLIRRLEFTSLSVAEVATQLFATALAIFLAIEGYTYEAIVAQGVAQSLSMLVTVVVLSRWWPSAPGAWRSEVRNIVVIGLRLFGTTVLRDASRTVVIPVMALFNPAAAIGNYDRAQQLAVVPINLTVDQLQRVAVPILSQFRRQPERMLAYMRRSQLAAAYLTATLFLLGASLGEPLFRIMLGPEWAFAGTVFQVLALGAIFRTLGQTMQWIFVSAAATGAGLKLALWSQPAIVIVTLAGLPWGVLGVAIANSIAYAAYWPVATVVASHSAGFKALPLIVDALRAWAYFGIPVALAAVCARGLGLGDVPTVIVGILFALVVAVVLAFAIKPVRQDLNALLEILRFARRG